MRKEQANWATYLIERSGKLFVTKGFNLDNNKRTARQHIGMPPRWLDRNGDPLPELGCDIPKKLQGSDGVEKLTESDAKAKDNAKPKAKKGGPLSWLRK